MVKIIHKIIKLIAIAVRLYPTSLTLLIISFVSMSVFKKSL